MRWLGSLPPIFSLFLFLWGLSHSGVNGQGAGGDLPIGLFPLSALGLPCLRSCSGGQGRQCRAGPSVLRDGCLVPVQDSSLPLLRYPVSLRRSGCACLGLRPCGKCLWLCLRKVPWNRPRSWFWLSIRLSSLWEGRLMGRRLVIVSSPLGGCVSCTPFRLSSVASAPSLSESWLFFLLWICRCYCRIQWRRPSRKLLRFP